MPQFQPGDRVLVTPEDSQRKPFHAEIVRAENIYCCGKPILFCDAGTFATGFCQSILQKSDSNRVTASNTFNGE